MQKRCFRGQFLAQDLPHSNSCTAFTLITEGLQPSDNEYDLCIPSVSGTTLGTLIDGRVGAYDTVHY